MITDGFAALNRRELPATTLDWVYIDHRRLAMIEAGDMAAYLRAGWDLTPQAIMHIETVHRLSITPDGFEAEWRMVIVYTVDGDLISRSEIFDETDIDVALARFDELSRPARQLDNAATRIRARVADAYNRRDLDGFLALRDGRYEDRRKACVMRGQWGRSLCARPLARADRDPHALGGRAGGLHGR